MILGVHERRQWPFLGGALSMSIGIAIGSFIGLQDLRSSLLDGSGTNALTFDTLQSAPWFTASLISIIFGAALLALSRPSLSYCFVLLPFGLIHLIVRPVRAIGRFRFVRFAYAIFGVVILLVGASMVTEPSTFETSLRYRDIELIGLIGLATGWACATAAGNAMLRSGRANPALLHSEDESNHHSKTSEAGQREVLVYTSLQADEKLKPQFPTVDEANEICRPLRLKTFSAARLEKPWVNALLQRGFHVCGRWTVTSPFGNKSRASVLSGCNDMVAIELRRRRGEQSTRLWSIMADETVVLTTDRQQDTQLENDFVSVTVVAEEDPEEMLAAHLTAVAGVSEKQRCYISKIDTAQIPVLMAIVEMDN